MFKAAASGPTVTGVITPTQQQAHDAAVAAGQQGYMDPDTGLFVMTADYLLAKGPCCNSGCRHCPYREPPLDRTSATPAATGVTRIVSLLPSATDILWFLGVGHKVVGVTYECTVPDGADRPPSVTDTIIPVGAAPAEIDKIIGAAMSEGRQLYELDRDLLLHLDADLIITQDLCRVCALPAASVEEAVDQLGCTANVLSYDPMTLDQVLDGMEAIGALVDADDLALARVQQLRDRVEASREMAAAGPRPSVLLLEWPDPAYGPGHWIPDLVEAAGGQPVLANPGGRSSAVEWADVAASDAEVLIVAPCGFDEAETQEQLQTVIARPDLAGLPAVQNDRCYAIDADEFIVRPGPRLVEGIRELAQRIHPERNLA